jgi:hypothetical protein
LSLSSSSPLGSVDLDVLRERNRELSTRVQELDLKLFQSLVTPLQTKLTHQLPPKLTHQRRRRTTPTRRLGVEPEEDQFEDAKEEASQMTNTDSEDKHSNAAEVDHEFDDSHSASRDHLVLLDHPSHPSPSSSPQQQQLSSEEDVKSLISLYENQFEKMKVLPFTASSLSLSLPQSPHCDRMRSVIFSYL